MSAPARYITQRFMMARLSKGGYLHTYHIIDKERRADRAEYRDQEPGLRKVGVMSIYAATRSGPEKRTYRIGKDEDHFNSAAEWTQEYERRLAEGKAP